ncbi:MAG: chemotaxis protein CheW [Gammaproteobacteria bacterium]|nr:chemotaxis protein CheW [Gammaproteobacteria bacterium]
MSSLPVELYSLLVPLADGRLVIPRACIAEVIGYQVPAQMTGAPPWYLGTITWNGRPVPLVSFECMNGHPIPPASARSRILVVHALGTRLEGGCFALISQGFPQLVRIGPEVVKPETQTYPDRGPVLCRVRMINDSPIVPDLERIEHMIADETRVMP